jgi:carboxypeptidase D
MGQFDQYALVRLHTRKIPRMERTLTPSRVEQPVGTGFSIGEVTATSEEDIAEDFVNWFLNFQNIFGIKNFKIYVTGESYAGRFVPYISAAMLDKNNTENFNLSGQSRL